MWCYNLTINHGLLLLIYIIAGIDSLTSSTTDCKCADFIQNAQCSQQTDCKWICRKGYWGDKCRFGRIRLTSSQGYITDGVNSYITLSKRMWLIDAGDRINATIHFQIEEFSTECNWDHLYIFDGDSTDSPLLAAFNGYLLGDVNSTSFGLIPQEIIAKSGSAYIYFYSDRGEVRSGFNISYSVRDKCSCLHGRCTDTAGLCVCDVGWTGSLCDVKKNCSTLCINGVCNQTLGNCVCSDGFTGNDCSQPTTSSYWSSLKTDNQDVEISPRTSHAAAIIGDEMWVYNGYKFSNAKSGTRGNLYRYNLKNKTWKMLPGREDHFTWGHSMVSYQGKLIVFGGEREGDHLIMDRLAEFDTNSSKWSLLNTSPVAVTGHTATVVGDKMIVIFGLSTDGLFPGVQEYDIGKSEWQVLKVESVSVVARYGHTSLYDSFSGRIYVYGGVTKSSSSSASSRYSASDSLMAYYPRSRKWITLASSNFRQMLHSAVLLDRMVVVFGGNPYIDHQRKEIMCHTTKLHVYDLACQKWHSEVLPQVAQTLARYGHSAVAKERAMYIFGGFNGALFNDVLTYTHGDCSQILNQTECMEKYFSAGCYWNRTQCVNRDSLKILPQCPGKHQKLCSEIKSCDECNSTRNCGWANKTCQVDGDQMCPMPSEDICPVYLNCKRCKNAGCHWNNSKCQRRDATVGASDDCAKSCLGHTTLSSCTKSSSCIWCENLERCVDSDLYVVSYPYGQCLEWTTSKKDIDQAVSCKSKRNCQDCFTLPSCGWNESEMEDGGGQCLKGGASGPKDGPHSKYWHFFDCPLCQCNGHSKCSVNSSVCLLCRDHTTGENCDTCADGYFGNPPDGGKCEPCRCNGHADTCDTGNGKCVCRMRGADGDHCEKCKASPYVGNATNGGSCYYQLTPDYLYRINVSEKSIFNFICSPKESDKDTVVTVNILKGNPQNPALMNISVGSDTMAEQYLLTNVELSKQYEEKFSKDNFPFGSENFHFKIYVYNISPYSSVSVSVHQPNDGGINLLKFFIIFLACFIGLLIFAVIFWKAKSFFDTFRRTRRRNVELVYMTNRPFASVPICMDKPGHVRMKTKPSPLTSEICYGNKAAVVTVLVRLPLCAQAENSTGASSLCLGSTLINYNEHQGSKMVNYMKNIKRRRNPFRSSPT